MKKHRVLVPTDGSSFSQQIYPQLLKLFIPAETEVILLRVGERPSGLVGLPPKLAAVNVSTPMYESGREVDLAVHPIYASQERDSAEAELRRLMLREASELQEAGYAVTVEVRFGGRGEEIVKYVQNHPVDLIAMTTHWRSGFQKLIFGSVAQYVARHVSTPIFLVHPDQPVSQAVQHGAKVHAAKAA